MVSSVWSSSRGFSALGFCACRREPIWVAFPFGVVQLTAGRFDDDIMETGSTEGLVRKFGWRFYAFAPLMAFLAPFLADCLHSFVIFQSGIRFYNAELERIAWPEFWIFVGLRGVFSFFMIWFLVWARFRDFWVWCCLVGLWFVVDSQLEIAIK